MWPSIQGLVLDSIIVRWHPNTHLLTAETAVSKYRCCCCCNLTHKCCEKCFITNFLGNLIHFRWSKRAGCPMYVIIKIFWPQLFERRWKASGANIGQPGTRPCNRTQAEFSTHYCRSLSSSVSVSLFFNWSWRIKYGSNVRVSSPRHKRTVTNTDPVMVFGRCYYIHYSSDQITKNEMSGACSTYGKRRGAYRIFEGKPEKQRQLGRHRRRCENNIKMEFQKVEIGGVNLIYLHQNRDRCRVLVMQWLTCGFHEMTVISWLVGDVLASQERRCSMALVSFSVLYTESDNPVWWS